MSEKHTCCAISYSRSSYFGCACGKTAKVERDGKHYCGIHDPVRVKEKRAASDEKFRNRMDEEIAARRKANAEAAERKRRADCYPDLLEALQRLLSAYSVSHSPEARKSCWDQARAAIKKATE